jgi:3-methyladenine DNA glycosylase AlkD
MTKPYVLANDQAAKDVQAALRALVDPEKAAFFPRFFKTGPGEYSEGDKFLGVTVPLQRQVAKQFRGLPIVEIEKLLKSEWHEARLTALFLLVDAYQKGDQTTKQASYELYMSHTAFINNWDLVDSSASFIVGPWLDKRPEKMQKLQQLARSQLLWERRIAMLATFDYIKQARPEEALVIAETLLHDKHDLIQKAVGWMLREMGKHVDRAILLSFLDDHAATMPRTTLRYAIEHLDETTRKRYMARALLAKSNAKEK